MMNPPSSSVHTIRLRRSLMDDTRTLATRNGLSVADYIASIVEQIAGERLSAPAQIDRSQTRIDIALPDDTWQKALRVAAVRNYRSVGDLVTAQIEEQIAVDRT